MVCSRSKATAYDLIGDYEGVLVSDCLNIYDELTSEQHKCYAHHLKAISQALTSPVAHGSWYLLEVRALLHGAMALKAIQAQLPKEQVQQMRQSLESNAERLLRHPRGDPSDGKTQQEEKVRQRLFKQRDHLFTFRFLATFGDQVSRGTLSRLRQIRNESFLVSDLLDHDMESYLSQLRGFGFRRV